MHELGYLLGFYSKHQNSLGITYTISVTFLFGSSAKKSSNANFVGGRYTFQIVPPALILGPHLCEAASDKQIFLILLKVLI